MHSTTVVYPKLVVRISIHLLLLKRLLNLDELIWQLATYIQPQYWFIWCSHVSHNWKLTACIYIDRVCPEWSIQHAYFRFQQNKSPIRSPLSYLQYEDETDSQRLGPTGCCFVRALLNFTVCVALQSHALLFQAGLAERTKSDQINASILTFISSEQYTPWIKMKICDIHNFPRISKWHELRSGHRKQ